MLKDYLQMVFHLPMLRRKSEKALGERIFEAELTV